MSASAAGQVREALGRIEAKIDAMADDVRWMSRDDSGDGRVAALLAEITKLRQQIEEIHEPVLKFANYKRRVWAVVAGFASLLGFLWAFAQPVYIQLVHRWFP